MKVLFVHNCYGIVSGEELMLERIMSLLRSRGHEVSSYLAHSSTIRTPGQKLGAGLSSLWSPKSRRELRELLRVDPPDLVQVQNLYPLISPSVLPVIKEAEIPIVMRLSNYRLICPNGLLLSHGRVCERCRGGREYHCVLRNCERSRIKSISYATRSWFSRVAGLYRKNVTRYYAQTHFQRQVIADEGYPEERIDVIPNMLDAPKDVAAWTPGSFVGFVGRLSEEKGVRVLFEAARSLPDIPFHLAGDPSSMPSGGSIPSNVSLRGQLAGVELTRFYEGAAMIVAPSIWYEGFPSVIIEAMAHTRPVIASSIGGLPEIVLDGETGTTPPPGDSDALARAILGLWKNPARRRAYGEAGALRVREQYSSQRYYERLMRTYQAARAAAQGEIHAL